MDKILQDMSDEELMSLCAHDNLGAFNILFHRYQKKILNFALRYLNEQDIAEEILQETFLRMYRFRKSFKGNSTFATWLHTIARNLCWDECQKSYQKIREMESSWDNLDEQWREKNRGLPPDFVGTKGFPDIPDYRQQEPIIKLEREELQVKVREAIDSLPQRQKEAVILSKYQEMSLTEIASALNCSVGAVKQLIHRALLSLKEKLVPYVEM
jgi:RNA polymerase sigma-70 factor (ECF subfamily)